MGTLPKSALVAGLALLGTTSSGFAEWPPQYGMPYEDQGNGQVDPHWILDEVTQCWAYDAHAGSDDTITWSGDCSDGKISGHGTLTYFDRGRMFERVTGEFSEGYLRDGRVSILWNDGSRYDGGEQNGQFNGYGTLIASDGTRYEGMWKDDKFQGGSDRDNSTQQTASNNIVSLQPQPKPIAKADPVQKPRANDKHENRNEKVYRLPWTQFARVLGKTLAAADGSKLTFERTENGSLRETIEHPEGASLSVTFVPLGAHLGTVQDSTGKIIATFRLSERTLSAAFDDGRVETASSTGVQGIRTYVRRAGAHVVSTDWYPAGHAFQRAANDPPPAKQLQKQDPPAPIDPPRVDTTKIAAVRSIEIRAGASEAVRRAHGATFKPSARLRPAPSEKPAEFALDVPRPGRRPERLPLFARHMDDRHATLVVRPHQSPVAQSIAPQTNLEALAAAPISAASQHRIALALRHRDKKHEQVATTTAPLTREPAESAAAPASIAPHVTRKVARNDTTSTDVPLDPPAPPAVPKPHTATPTSTVRMAAADPSSEPHPARPAQHAKVNAPPSPAKAQAVVPAKPARLADADAPPTRVTPPKPVDLSGSAIPAKPVRLAAVDPAPVPHAARPANPPKAQAAAPAKPARIAGADSTPTPAHIAPPKQPDPAGTAIQAKPVHLAATDPATAQPHVVAPAKHADVVVPAPSIPKAQIAAQIQPMKSVLPPPAAATHNAAPAARQAEDTADASTPSAVASATPAIPASQPAMPTPTSMPPASQLAALPKHDDKHGAVAAVVSALSSPAMASPAPPVAASAPPPALHTIGIGPVPRRSASDCLTVESNGTHWGFRNHCPADIQFSYCLLNSSDRLISCSTGAAAGSVAGNGFSALVADTSIKDPRANRAFRWVGCVGGAGEVSPRLDRIDPPMGRCLHSGQVPEGVERADVIVHRR